MIQSTGLKDVPVVIKYGQIQNPEILRPGDLLLFAGADTSRSAADFVGHVEMVAKINGSKVTIYGHGSGTPRSTDMASYCSSRYNSKTKTKLGNKGLIRVRRFIQDDVAAEPTTTASGNKVKITGGSVNVRSGPGTNFPALDVAKQGDTYPAINTDGWRAINLGSMIGWVSAKYSEEVKG